MNTNLADQAIRQWLRSVQLSLLTTEFEFDNSVAWGPGTWKTEKVFVMIAAHVVHTADAIIVEYTEGPLRYLFKEILRTGCRALEIIGNRRKSSALLWRI